MSARSFRELRGVWSGRTVACIASGPSLTPEDCSAVKNAGLLAIAVNSSFRAAPWADVLYGMDATWWQVHQAEVAAAFSGLKVGGTIRCHAYGADITTALRWRGNSGAGAVALAAYMGATVIILIGYDCQHTGGRTHWHGDHPTSLGNAGGVGRWPRQFDLLAILLRSRKVRVVNCSRQTALMCFERGTLAEFLR